MMQNNPYHRGDNQTAAIDHRLTGPPEEIYQKGFHDGYLEGSKFAIKAMQDYEATVLRPIIIHTPPKEEI